MSDRKRDHIELSFSSQIKDRPFWVNSLRYEAALATHIEEDISTSILEKKLEAPLFVSSMTGGTELAKSINERLAKNCKQYGIGMGLGSCRPLLEDKTHLDDFQVRKYLGDDLPLLANLGVYQVSELIKNNKLELLNNLMKELDADLLMVHINPLQELIQREGDRYFESSITTLKKLFDKVDFKVGVKEVGQGFGPESIEALHELPIKLLEFASFGGTNFCEIEFKRINEEEAYLKDVYEDLKYLGHDSIDMINMINRIEDKGIDYIVSGGIKTPLFAHYLSLNFNRNHAVGMASSFLKPALESEEKLNLYTDHLIKTMKYLRSFVFLKEDKL